SKQRPGRVGAAISTSAAGAIGNERHRHARPPATRCSKDCSQRQGSCNLEQLIASTWRPWDIDPRDGNSSVGICLVCRLSSTLVFRLIFRVLVLDDTMVRVPRG